jgi:hypothetical protein
MPADISQGSCAQQRIHNGMQENISIRMAKKSLFIRDLDAANDQFPVLCQPMNIISHADSHN